MPVEKIAQSGNGAKEIFAYTDAGNTPRIISSLLPTCPIIAVTTDEKTYRQLAIVADVIPLLINEKGEPRDIIEKGKCLAVFK